MAFFNILPAQFPNLKILDTASAASSFAILLGALLVRQQFVLGFRPRIGYKSITSIKQDGCNTDECRETWKVTLHNAGLGAAIINRCAFELETSSVKNKSSTLVFDEVVRELEKSGLAFRTDYWLENITDGFTLPPKEECILFEIKTEHLQKIKRLDMSLHFQGFLGDTYTRQVFLMPPDLMKPISLSFR